MKSLLGILALGSAFWCCAQVSIAQDVVPVRQELVLDEHCIVSVLNRTVHADKEGLFTLPNIPSFMGAVRARASCIRGDKTIVGQTDFFNVITNDQVETGSFYIGEERVPTNLTLNNGLTVRMFGADLSRTLSVQAGFADGTTEWLDLTQPNHGVNFNTSNSDIATVDTNGIVTSHATGETLLTARKDGVIAISTVAVITGGDKDGDGMPDYYEDLYGLNPNDPVDAFEDLDADGLSNAEEFSLSTEPNNADTDGDKILDGEEVVVGGDGFVTEPLLADTDGDGLSDSLEVSFGFDPLDSLSGDLQSVLESIEVTPGIVNIPYNTINAESTWQLAVIGHLIDGSTLDLTSVARGTSYASANLEVASFGVESGKIYAGAEGSTQITVTNGNFSAMVPVTVTTFTPQALSEIVVGGGLNKIALHEQFAFIVGSSGLHVIDVSNPQAPLPIATLKLPSSGQDIKLKNGKAYITASSSLIIVDIQDPTVPVLLSVFDMPRVFATDLVLQGDYAFVAGNYSGVRIINIRDDQNVFEVSSIDVNSGSFGRDSARAIELGGGRLFVATNSGIHVFDIQQLESPVRLFSINRNRVNTLAFSGEVLHAAADVGGWSSYRLMADGSLVLLAGGGVQEFAPLDIAISKDFVFWSGINPNLVSYTNIQFEEPFFQNVIDFPRPEYSLYTTWGIAIDNQYVYTIDKQRLAIAQYKMVDDLLGLAPSITLVTEKSDYSFTDYVLEAVAEDDVGVDRVEFYSNEGLVFSDSIYPYILSFSPVEFENLECNSPDGAVELRAKAIDFAGNVAWSNVNFIDVSADLDCDNDGLGYGYEIEIGTDPFQKDTDGDLLDDSEEVARKTNPLNVDSDGDGFEDGAEVAAGTDPLNPDVTPPELLETIPASNAIDVREDTRIDLFFDGSLRRETVTAAIVKLLKPDGSVIESEILLSDDGAKISIQPLRFLTAETVYRVSAVGLRDAAGNVAADILYSFQTGFNLELDDVSPTATFLRSTGYEEPEVPTNVVPTVVFDEPITPETLTIDSFYLEDSETQERVDGFVSLSHDRTVAQFIPSRVLHVGRRYGQYLTADIKDLWGNSLKELNNRGFVTGFAVDAQPPEVVVTTLPDGLSDVPLNVRLRVRFNERISKHTLRNVKLFNNGELVEANYKINDFGDLITLTPALPLEPMSEYQWQIGAVEDMAGNLFESNRIINFETGLVADTESSNGQEWVSFEDHKDWHGRLFPSNVDLSVRLLERIDPTSIEVYQHSTFPQGWVYSRWGAFYFRSVWGGKLPYTVILSDDAQTLTLMPGDPLIPGPRYQLSDGHGLTDLAGNNVGGSFNVNFTLSDMADAEAPIELLSSFGGTDAVLHNGNLIRLNYSEFLSEKCFKSEAIALTNNGLDVPFSIALSPNGRTIEITPDTTLEDGDGYSLSLTGICDLAGNQTPAKSYNFSVANKNDDTPPVLIQSPEEPLPIGTRELVWVFDEALDPSSTVQLYNVGDGPYGPEYLEGSVVVEGNVLRFTPDEPLMQGRQYYTGADSTWIADISGNELRFYFPFNTELVNDTVPPSVITSSPLDGAINVSANQPVTIQFSEPIDFDDATIAFWSYGQLTKPHVLLSPDRTLITLYGMPSDSLMSLVILGATDFSGNVLPNHIVTYATRNDISSGSGGSIQALIPAMGATALTNVPEITLLSSSVVNEATLVDGFKVYSNNIEVAGSISLAAEGRVVRFVPDVPFQEGDRIDYQVHYTVTNIQGFSLGSYNGFFTMASDNDSFGEPASVIGFYPAADAVNVPLNTSLDLLFDEPIDPTSLVGNVLLIDENENFVSITAGIDSDNHKLVALQANTTLLSDHTYTLKVLGGLRDTDGDLVGLEYSSQFTTGNGWIDDRAPMLLATTPVDGDVDVIINAFISAKYDEPLNPLRIQPEDDLYHVQLTQDNTVIRYQLTNLHPADQLKQFQLPAVVDGAGNRAEDATISFTSATSLDDRNLGSPTEIKGRNGIREFIFNKTIDPLSVSESTVVLTPKNGGEAIPLLISLVNDDKTIYVTPAEILPVGEYKYSIAGVHSVGGFWPLMTTSVFSITEMLVDAEAPVLLKAKIPDGLTDVPLTISFALVFDETINTKSFDAFKLLDASGATIETAVTRSGTTVYITPQFILKPFSQYSLEYTGAADLAGNAITVESKIHFETGGEIGPYIRANSWVTPPLTGNSPGTETVPVNVLVKAVFDKVVDVTRLSSSTGRSKFADIIDVTSDETNYKVGISIPGSIVLGDDLKTISIEPNEGWKPGRVYRIALGRSEGGSRWDKNPTAYAYSIADKTLSVSRSMVFRTAASSDLDLTPPVVLRTEPEALSSVTSLVWIKVILDELLSPDCEDLQTVTLENDSGVTSLASSYSSWNKTLSVRVPLSLVSGVNKYSLGGACDLAGNIMPPFSFDFTVAQ